ncbi:MAG: DUF948 domain-containing protein [Candidatus Aminicenantia bacterium]
MNLTLIEFLLLIITLAIVGFIAYLIPAIRQIKDTAKRGEETLIELRELISNLRDTERLVKAQIEGVEELITSSKEALSNISETAWFISKKMLKPSTRYIAFLFPLLKAGWQLYKKRKKGGQK